MSDQHTLYLIDASGFLYRAFFAIQGLSSKGGEATGALFGFIRSYLRLIKDFQPTYVVAVFDAEGSKESRSAIYKEYKSHRKPTPAELSLQINEARKFCELAAIPLLAVRGVEADDTMGSIALWAKTVGMNVAIVTADKDMAQMIDDHCILLNPHKDNLKIDAAKAKEIYGVSPNQMRDFLAICGDASDNVPGISGFGPKTAISLLEQYTTLESILANADAIGGKKAQTLHEQKEAALISQKLVTIDTKVPFEKNLELFKVGNVDREGLAHFLREKSFHSLITPLLGAVEKKPTTSHCHTITSEDELSQALEQLSKNKLLCVYTETSDLNAMRAKLVGIGLAASKEDLYYIPYEERYLSYLKPFFANSSIGFYGHNIKFDLHVLENASMPIAKVSADTVISSYVLNAHERRHSLDALVMDCLHRQMSSIEEVIGKGKNQISMDKAPVDKVSAYCCEKLECTLLLKDFLDKEIVSRGLTKLLYELEIPLISVLSKMEATGIYVDKKELKELSERVLIDIKKLEETIYQMAGRPFNLNSPKQLSEVLYIDLGLRAPRKGKSQPSTSADVLETLALEYPIAEKILEYRGLEKIRSTYLDTIVEQINPKTGRIHCTFNQFVTATGRLSCQDPNLQNIPIRSELGQSIRAAFKPQTEGYSFLSADYSQIELRILAHVCEDEGLLSAFQNNIDVHAYTASQIFCVPVEAVTEQMRQQSKAVNFGIIYGQQAFGLSQALRIPLGAANAFIEAYFNRYKRVKEYIENAKKVARETGKAVSLMGRQRLLPDINSSNMMLRSAAERLAVNTPFQALAADIIKMAMIKIDEWLSQSKLKTKMLLQIHDELIFEVPDDELEVVSEGVKERMEGVIDLKVPLIVKIGVGKNWQTC